MTVQDSNVLKQAASALSEAPVVPMPTEKTFGLLRIGGSLQDHIRCIFIYGFQVMLCYFYCSSTHRYKFSQYQSRNIRVFKKYYMKRGLLVLFRYDFTNDTNEHCDPFPIPPGIRGDICVTVETLHWRLHCTVLQMYSLHSLSSLSPSEGSSRKGSLSPKLWKNMIVCSRKV